MSIMLESPRACLFEQYGLKVSQKGLELSEFEILLKYPDFVWLFDLLALFFNLDLFMIGFLRAFL